MLASVQKQMLEEIDAVTDLVQLRMQREEVQQKIELLSPSQPIARMNDLLNQVHDAIIRRTVLLTEREMARMGRGSPPVPYAYVLFGSGGRGEQTFSSDQDSGVIYWDPAENKTDVSLYFKELCAMVVLHLEKVGYPLCEGNVLSSNPDWTHPVTLWAQKINGWLARLDWEAVRYLLIISDMRWVYGDLSLVETIKQSYAIETREQSVIIRRMLENTMHRKLLLGVFGQLLKEEYGEDSGSIDIKYGAYIPMVNVVRLMSVQAGIKETSTFARLKELGRLGIISTKDAKRFEQVFAHILRLRLMTKVKQDNGYFEDNGMLPLDKLSKEELVQLKECLRSGQKLQKLAQKQVQSKLM